MVRPLKKLKQNLKKKKEKKEEKERFNIECAHEQINSVNTLAISTTTMNFLNYLTLTRHDVRPTS